MIDLEQLSKFSPTVIVLIVCVWLILKVMRHLQESNIHYSQEVAKINAANMRAREESNDSHKAVVTDIIKTQAEERKEERLSRERSMERLARSLDGLSDSIRRGDT